MQSLNPSRGVDLNQWSLMVPDVCWNPPRGADVLGQELVVLIKAPCPSVQARDWDCVCQGADSALGVYRELSSLSSIPWQEYPAAINLARVDENRLGS